ncbi:MAG: ABC transporter permease, partial [Bacilli bacterium]
LVFLFYVCELLFSFVRLHVYANEGRSFAVVRVLYYYCCLVAYLYGVPAIVSVGAGIGLLILAIYSLVRTRTVTLQFESLLAEEEARSRAYTAFFGLFVDLPRTHKRSRSRAYMRFWWDAATKPYDYLLRLLFVRTDESFVLVVRLIVVGSLLLIGVPNLYAHAFIAGLFVLFVHMQIQPVERLAEHTLWDHIYPLDQREKRAAFHRMYIGVMFICSGIWTMVSAVVLKSVQAPLLVLSVLLGVSTILTLLSGRRK